MHCSHCRRALAPGALHYRFAVALEGEQLALDDGSSSSDGEALVKLLAQLEAGPEDPTSYDEQVHWERSGALCVSCRGLLMTFFGSEPLGPH
jgi:hypothetical protein